MNRARVTDHIKQDKLRRHSPLLNENLTVQEQQKLPQKPPNIVVRPSDKQRRSLLPMMQHEQGTVQSTGLKPVHDLHNGRAQWSNHY